ncbi:hypothetical protein [Azospirillum canadense]|uniref:hypothetical protein n=1 Tax=Azospirillum canadense TaxID=403962 RepID=UPI002226E21C|nr:hypothetical protein [Azospirillum canadense]MCW2240746.1 hypothetical protein [Azospirillum canadense]
MNHPAPRDIPAGKVLLCEYRDARREDMAIVETLASKHSDQPAIRSTVTLLWSSPGWEIAGSMLRWTNGYYGVRFTANDGAIHGRRFQSEDAARTLFAAWTVPVPQATATTTPVTQPAAQAETTCRGALAGQTSRTVGTIRLDDAEFPLILRRSPATGCVTPCIRDGKKVSPISGRFRDDDTLSHLVSHLKEFVLADNAVLTLAIA